MFFFFFGYDIVVHWHTFDLINLASVRDSAACLSKWPFDRLICMLSHHPTKHFISLPTVRSIPSLPLFVQGTIPEKRPISFRSRSLVTAWEAPRSNLGFNRAKILMFQCQGPDLYRAHNQRVTADSRCSHDYLSKLPDGEIRFEFFELTKRNVMKIWQFSNFRIVSFFFQKPKDY